MSLRLFHVGPYRTLLRLPDAARLVFSGLLGRMPAGMAGLSIILLVQEATGSYASAGLVGGCYSVTVALGAPLQGRLIDRFGQRVLLPAAVMFGAAFSGLGLAAAAGAPLPMLYVLAALAGLNMPALAACIRTLWATIVARAGAGREAAPGATTTEVIVEPGVPVATRAAGTAQPQVAPSGEAQPGGSGSRDRGSRRPRRRLAGERLPTLQTAYGFESTVQELIFITGPFVVALMVRFASPMYAMLLGAALAVTGTALFVTTPTSRNWRPSPRASRHWAGPLRSQGIRVLVLLGLLFGASIGSMEVSVAAFAAEHGSRGSAGLLLAVWSTGSAIGGLWFGSRHWTGAVTDRLLTLSWLVAVCFVPAVLAWSIPVMAPALFINGLCIAPLLATLYLQVDRLAPKGAVTEAFTWINTGFISGIASGVALAGALIEASGIRTALGTAALGAALSAIIGTAGRRRLRAARDEDEAVAKAA